MKRPIPGKAYRLENKECWSFRSHKQFVEAKFLAQSDVKVYDGDILVCLRPDLVFEWRYAGVKRTRYAGVWFYKGKIVYDTPAEAEFNDGYEDNVMKFLVPL